MEIDENNHSFNSNPTEVEMQDFNDGNILGGPSSNGQFPKTSNIHCNCSIEIQELRNKLKESMVRNPFHIK